MRCTIEQFALDTQDLNGAELITECVFAKRSAPDSPIVGLHHFRATSVRHESSLKPRDVRIEIAAGARTLSIATFDGRTNDRQFDQADRPVRQATTGAGFPNIGVPPGSAMNTGFRPVPIAVAAIGASVAAVLAVAARRRAA